MQQNANDRSQATLNEVMDTKLKPVHGEWSALWAAQQQAENEVAAVVAERDRLDEEFSESIRSVYRSIQASQGAKSPSIKQYVPGGNLNILERPFSRRVSEMTSYAQVIAQAAGEVIPTSTRDNFGLVFGKSVDIQARLDAAKKKARDTQRAREAKDGAWDKAYDDYHRAVEYVVQGDRGLIKTWIRIWPDPAYASKPATPAPATPAPATSAPATGVPAAAVPATAAPTTAAPTTTSATTSATSAPTTAPQSEAAAPSPATSAAATSAAATSAPATSAPATSAPATPSPATSAPQPEAAASA